MRVAHPAHCRVRLARLAEGSAPEGSAAVVGAAVVGAAAGAAGAGAAAGEAVGAGASAGAGEGMVLHNVPAGSRLLVRAWRDGDVLQPHARPTPHPNPNLKP